jgi:hypothetical protein
LSGFCSCERTTSGIGSSCPTVKLGCKMLEIILEINVNTVVVTE